MMRDMIRRHGRDIDIWSIDNRRLHGVGCYGERAFDELARAVHIEGTRRIGVPI